MEGQQLTQTPSSAVSQPPLIPVEWAIEQLKAHWPALEIEEVLPPRAREMTAFKGTMPGAGALCIRMLTADPQDPQGPHRLKAAFQRAQALAAIENPFSIPVMQAGSVSGCLVIVTGWREGVPLDQYLKREKVPVESALAMIDCLAKAFETYHAAGWVHGHLRADSVLVTSHNEVVVSGFGLLDTVTGYIPDPLDPNRLYVSPERNGREEDPPEVVADVYNVGVVAYEILTSEQPSGQFMKLPSQVTGAGAWLDDVILRSIHSKPGKRIQNLTEFRREMAEQRVRMMDLSKPEKEDKEPRVSKEVSGSAAMLRKSFYGFMAFSLIVVCAAIWLGQAFYENQEEASVTTGQAVALMSELLGTLKDEGEGSNMQAIVEELSKASPEIQHEALLEKVKAMKSEGKHEDAIKLTKQMLDMNSGSEGPGIEGMKGVLADLGESLSERKALLMQADEALADFDFGGEETALEKLLGDSPADPVIQRRLSQIPKYFMPNWEQVEKEMKKWNPKQRDWHISMHRDASGLEIDLSGHSEVYTINGLEDLPIDRLDLRHTKIQDVSAVRNMSLRALWCDHTDLVSIDGLERQPIEILGISKTKVTDFGPLEKFAFLRTLRVDEGIDFAPKLETPFSSTEWENSVGQRFLPLSGMGALMGNREVTEIDYAAFIIAERSESLVIGAEKELEAEATLNPMLVTLADALSFCEWLTRYEQEAGYLPLGATYRLPEAGEIERLTKHISTAAVEDGAYSVLEGAAIRAVAEGPCLHGFFDVKDNAEEWSLDFRAKQLYRLRGEMPKGTTEATLRGIRLVLDLREADYEAKKVTAIASEETEESN